MFVINLVVVFFRFSFSLSVVAVVSFLIKLSAVVNWAILRSEYKLIIFELLFWWLG